VHIGTIKVFYLPTDAQWSCFKRILKFTLKQLGGVTAATPPNQPQLCILTDYFNNHNFSKLK
jgi:hypothetical protein